MKQKISVLLLTLAITIGQAQNVKIGESIALRKGLCEPSIAINRVDPANVVVGAVLNRFFYSKDSGKTWTGGVLTSSIGVWGDPILISDYLGNIYFLHLSDPTGMNWDSEEILDRIVSQKSSNGGMNWNDGSYMGYHPPKDQDKPGAVVDRNTNEIHVTWTQFDHYGSRDSADQSNILYSKSMDGGLSWTESVAINQYPGDCLDGDQTTEGAVPAISPYGYIYVAWAYNEKIYFDRSEDSGKTWLDEDILIAHQPGGWAIDIPGLMRANGMPVTVCDGSEGPFRGNVYVSWVDDRSGNYDVWFSKSLDNGNIWIPPTRINDDTTKSDQFFSWMACDPETGYLYCVFYDRRNYHDLQTSVYLAYSKDGGQIWVNEKISEAPFTPTSSVFFGDYNYIDAYKGMVLPVWTRYDDEGTMSIWTALLNFRD